MAGEEPERVRVDEVLPPNAPDPANTAPPKDGPKAALRKAFPGVIARVLDNLIEIPNTKYRVGLDPLLGFFFAWFGDAVSAVAGAAILAEGVRRGVPAEVARRMAFNILINAGVGAVPVIGDAFSFWFKSNARNHALLKRHADDQHFPQVQLSMWPIFLFLLVALGLVAGVATGIVLLANWIF